MAQNIRLILSFLIILSTSIVFAQPPGGATTGGGVIPNPEVRDIDEIELESKPDIDIDSENAGLFGRGTRQPELNITPAAENPLADQSRIPFDAAAFSAKMENFVVPDDWSQIDLTGEMPSFDEILSMRDELPEDIDIDSLDILPESSATATNAIVGYASSMLGLTVTPLYAGEYYSGDVDANEAAQTTISVIYDELDADMQALMQQADELSGITYWALLEDGLALLYTGDCDLDQCTIQQDRVQVEITSGSAGAYTLYNDSIPASSDESKVLIQSTYPYLATIDLAETESSAGGYAFFAFDIDVESGAVTAYYAGVYPSDAGKSIVYVVSGIGDAYINMLLGG